MTCVPTTSEPYTALKNIPGTVSIPEWNGLQDTLLSRKKVLRFNDRYRELNF